MGSTSATVDGKQAAMLADNGSAKGTLSSGSQYALVSSGTLTAGKPYTVSGYVNTSAVTKIEGGGVSITVTDGSQGWTSQWINYITSTAVDDGWVA